MPPVRLLFDARTVTPHYPGVGRYGRGLLGALSERPDVDLALLLAPGQPADGLPAGRRITAAAGPRSPAGQLLNPARIARACPPGRTLCHAPFYVFDYLVRLPVVVTLYDLIPFEPQSGFSRAARLTYGLAHRLAAARARRIIALARASRADLHQRLGLPASKIVVVPPGHTPVAPASGSGGLPPAYLLYVGINKPHKNLVRLVAAYARLGPNAPPLLIAGPDDPRYPAARQAAEQAGLGDRVCFLGRVGEAELARLYANASLFVFPSLAEGFGFPVLEAMASGTPVACSDIPVLRELAEEAAVYFDPRSPEALAACLADALAQPQRLEERRALGRALAARYTWQAAAAQTVEVYRQALGQPAEG
jgi:glycosyltransferase involved in cell wall biosynthesis